MEGPTPAPLRRKDTTAVHSLHRFVFSVPDLKAAIDFYDAFGLDVREAEGRADLYTMGHPQRWASIYQRPGSKQLDYVSFGIYADDVDALAKRLAQKGVATITPHALADEQGTWIRDPEGTPVQIVVAAKVSPSAKSTGSAPVIVPGTRRGTHPFRHRYRPPASPIAHPALQLRCAPVRAFLHGGAWACASPIVRATSIAFLHGAHASDHHMLAFAKSDGPGLHHSSWDVASIDEVGLGMQQMAERGHVQGWGVGRHVIGSNYFRYVRDPWGSFAEYSYDIDFIPADVEWNAGDYAPEDSFYVWGPPVPDDFVINHESASRRKSA